MTANMQTNLEPILKVLREDYLRKTFEDAVRNFTVSVDGGRTALYSVPKSVNSLISEASYTGVLLRRACEQAFGLSLSHLDTHEARVKAIQTVLKPHAVLSSQIAQSLADLDPYSNVCWMAYHMLHLLESPARVVSLLMALVSASTDSESNVSFFQPPDMVDPRIGVTVSLFDYATRHGLFSVTNGIAAERSAKVLLLRRPVRVQYDTKEATLTLSYIRRLPGLIGLLDEYNALTLTEGGVYA